MIMPNFFNEQFWVAFSFIFLVAILYRPFKKALIKYLDERAVKITKELSEAENLKKETLKLLEQAKERHKEASLEADKIHKKAIKDAERIKKEFGNKIDEMILQKEKIAAQKIASYESVAKENLNIEASLIAIEVTKKIIKEQINNSTENDIIEDSIDKISVLNKN